jgi:hypothetical protein
MLLLPPLLPALPLPPLLPACLKPVTRRQSSSWTPTHDKPLLLPLPRLLGLPAGDLPPENAPPAGIEPTASWVRMSQSTTPAALPAAAHQTSVNK